MKNVYFEKEIKEILPLVLRYASDYFGMSNFKSLKKSLKAIDHFEFLKKCNEGFKMAQDKILHGLLEIEDEIKEKKSFLKNYEKGKSREGLKKDKGRVSFQREIQTLEFQKATFKELANVIVWTLLGLERAHVKFFLKPGGCSGYLKDRNIQSVASVANTLNEIDEQFALISDITSTLHIGDLLVAKKGTIGIMEVKADSQINNNISSIIHTLFEKNTINFDLMRELHQDSPKHGFIQLRRSWRQAVRMVGAKEYIQTDKTYDHDLKAHREAHDKLTRPIQLSKLINYALKCFYEEKRNYIFMPTDCCLLGIFKRSGSNSELASGSNFKHLLYHNLFKPWDECNYVHPPVGGYSEETPPEFAIYSDFVIYSLRNKVYIPTEMPIFILIDEEYVIDLLLGRIDIYLYFDSKHFLEMIKERGLDYDLVEPNKFLIINPEMKGEKLPEFNGKYLLLKYKNSSVWFGYGSLYLMIYGLEAGYSVIERMKDDLFQMERPRLYNFFSKVIKAYNNVMFKYFLLH